ncbi:MAG: L-methionine (R)-S-oxide reductase [Bradymonadia bacterium]
MTDAARTDAEWLAQQVRAFGAVAGTVHRRHGMHLELTAAQNIPPAVEALTQTIPAGKGMAGLAWSRGASVQTCDLKTDETGDVQPGARAVDASAAIAVPVFNAVDSVRAVVGLAFAQTDALSVATITALEAAAAGLPR